MSKVGSDKPAHSQERRVGKKPIPDDIGANLTDWQKQAIGRLESFGWSIRFIRRPLFEEPLVIVCDPSGKDFAVLTDDGRLDRKTDLTIR
jgi:hypothetical protein